MRTIGLILTPEPERPENITCPHCGKEYKSGAALRTHCKKEHPEAFDATDKSEQ